MTKLIENRQSLVALLAALDEVRRITGGTETPGHVIAVQGYEDPLSVTLVDTSNPYVDKLKYVATIGAGKESFLHETHEMCKAAGVLEIPLVFRAYRDDNETGKWVPIDPSTLDQRTPCGHLVEYQFRPPL